MKLVGGDSGHVEHEQFVDDVVLAPSERVVVDVLFAQDGEFALEHHTPDRVYPLAAITVSDGARPSRRSRSSSRSCAPTPTWRPSASASRRIWQAEPDKTLAFLAEMDMDAPEGDGPVVYTCPMHPEVVSEAARPLP